MSNSPNKVRFTIDNVHYAKLTTSVVNGVESYSYGTPVHVPGTSNLDLTAEGDISRWPADGIDYWVSENNNGYSGDWENAIFPDQMLKDIWGLIEQSTDKTLLETADAETNEFALLFRLRGDKYRRLVVLYRCVAGRPNIGSSGSSGRNEPQPQSISINAMPRGDGRIRCCTTPDTTSSVISGWFSSVYAPSFSAGNSPSV